ncbi:MAG TPA: hypothetical protein VFG29_00305 [Syntrophales bacterium]|nr:hypothetical protein [Syntrophales bacterium]
MRKIISAFFGLVILCTPLYGQEFYLLGGGLGDTATTDRSYSWALEYMQGLGEYAAFSISWLNEGHLPDNHRDGITAQLWARTKKIDRQFVLAAGAGPYYYYDTLLAERGRGFSDTHGIGGVFSLAGFWYTESPWVIQLRSNMIKTNNIDTWSAMVGIGYQLDYSNSRSPASEAKETRNTTESEMSVLIGQTTINSANSQQSVAESIEYRRGIARYLDWTVALVNEGDNRLANRAGILTELWAVRDFANDHLALGIGLGPYFLVDMHRSPRETQDWYSVAGVVSLSASYRFNPNWLARITWNRIATNYDRDADVIMIGPGYRF